MPGQRLASPLDNYIPSNDVDFFLMGQMEQRKAFRDYITSGGNIQGPYGHIIGQRSVGPPSSALHLGQELRNMYDHENQTHHRLRRRSVVSLTGSGALAWDQDPVAIYFQRSDTITSGAGDAKAVNAATHVIDPWPRYVGNRRIPANGDRMSRAVERYRQGSYRPPAPPISPLLCGGGGTGLAGGGRRVAGGGGARAAAGGGGGGGGGGWGAWRRTLKPDHVNWRPGSIHEMMNAEPLRACKTFHFSSWATLGIWQYYDALDHDHTGEDFSSSGP